ncbi:MAG TPA: SH3 domain-containing protein [Candidatus Saccharimonas sp.]|nr:SH3 domain-containing protein [Candidatus Saccharimonas sp.]
MIVLVAAGLTGATYVMAGGRVAVLDGLVGTAGPTPTATVKSTATPVPTPTATPTPTPTATATPEVTPAARTARAVSYVRLRQGPSTNTAVLTQLYGGEIVTLGGYSDAQWQEVYYNGFHGYIYKTYLQYL